MRPKQEVGQALVEYLILTLVISVATLGVASLVGLNIQELYANLSNKLGNRPEQRLTAPDADSVKRRGLSGEYGQQ